MGEGERIEGGRCERGMDGWRERERERNEGGKERWVKEMGRVEGGRGERGMERGRGWVKEMGKD